MTSRQQPARHLRWWFAVATAAILLCTVMVSVVVIALSNARSSTDVADDFVRRMGERTADLMVGHLDDAVESADLLITLLPEDALRDRDDEIDRLLAAQVRTVSQLSGAFVGFPDGDFRFVARREEGLVLRRIENEPLRRTVDAPVRDDLTVGVGERVDTDYDPRTRPWYEAALGSDESIWTAPYVFFSSGQPGVTLSQSIHGDRGELLAVVGIDVSLAELTQFLDDLPIDDGAEAFITAGDHVVAAPTGYDLIRPDDSGDVQLGTLTDLGIGPDAFRQLATGSSPLETDDGGRLHLIELTAPDAPRWAVLVRTDQPEISASVERAARWSIVAVLITGAILLAAVPLVTRALRRTIDDLHRRTRFDHLTALLNRGAMMESARQALAESTAGGRELTVAILDLDDLKQINDRLGHPTGDEALADLGEVILRSVRSFDIVGRIGGDEFAIVFRHLDRPDVDSVLRRIQDRLAHRDVAEPDRPHLSVTIGVAARGERTLEMAELIAEADAALIRAKQVRKGVIAWSESTDAIDEGRPTTV